MMGAVAARLKATEKSRHSPVIYLHLEKFSAAWFCPVKVAAVWPKAVIM